MTVVAAPVLTVDLAGSQDSCGPDCSEFVATWTAWLAKNGRDTLAVADCSPGYRDRLGRNGRQMLNKADRLYTYRPIVRNEHLDAMYAINTSVPVRQERPMTAAYREPLELGAAARLCDYHQDRWAGGFDQGGTLRAYARAEGFGDFWILNTIIGDRAAGGVTNGLIAYLAESPDVLWLNYLRIRSASESLSAFKVRTGFVEMRVR